MWFKGEGLLVLYILFSTIGHNKVEKNLHAEGGNKTILPPFDINLFEFYQVKFKT